MISRHFTSLPKLPSLSKIPSKYKSRAVKEAQEVLTDYLHLTRLVPFTYAENISKYSIISLSNLIANLNSDVGFKVSDFPKSFQKFLRFDVSNEDACLLLLQRPEIFNFDLDKKVISVQGLLRHFGLSDEELESVARKYSHIMGRNKMANLPHVMRALDLHLWFFNEIKKGNHPLLASYSMSDSNDDIDEEYRAYLEIIRASRTPVHTRNKLDFVHGIGFAENALCVKIFVHLHGTSTELQERFDCLLDAGISFSNVCSMINRAPKIMNQSPEMIVDKVNYLCCEMGGSLHDLVAFPAFLCFDLEKRIKPRHRFQKLVMEKGLCTLNYSVASIVATSEKCFLARAHGMCPAALKHYFECLLPRSLANNEVS